jgi:Acetyltransferase (GNAT) domain
LLFLRQWKMYVRFKRKMSTVGHLRDRMKIVSHFDLQPTLVGETISLRPLITDDFEALYAAASDPLIWEQHPEPLRYQRQVFDGFFAGALASGGALLVTDKTSGEVIGTSRYYEWNPDQREVAIGYTFLVGELAMTPKISLVAVCCSSDSLSSWNSRTFSMAMTA